MTGDQFRALLDAAALTVRAAAKALSEGRTDGKKVSPATVQRWAKWPDERSPTPYWAVHRLQQIAAQRQEGEQR